MAEEKKIPIPPKLLLLDLVGVLMAGLGLAKIFANVDVLPEQYRFEHYAIVFVAVGFALTMPLIFHIVKTASAKKPG